MAINYNAGFLPQQLYQNIFNAQRAGLEERNRRERERFQNLGNIAGNFIRYNRNKGDQQLKDFEERYKTQRSELVGSRDKYDPRATKFKEIQDQINLLDQDYANMKQEFNQTGFLNMGRDQSVLDLPDRTGPFAKKLINPRTGVPFIGGPGKAFDDEPIGYFQPASVDPEGTKEAYALRDKQAEMGFLTKALRQQGIDRAQTELDFVGKLQKAKTKAEIDSLFQTLGNEDLQKLIRTVEGEAQLNKGRIANEIFGDQTSYVIERLRQKLGEQNIAQLDLLRDSIEPKLNLAQGQANIQDESYQKRAGIDTIEQRKRGRDAAQTGLEYLGPRRAIENAFDIAKYSDMTPLVANRNKLIGDDNQRRELETFREKFGLETGKAIALLNLRNKFANEQLELKNKLSQKTPAQIEAKRREDYRKAYKEFLNELIPEGGFLDGEFGLQNAVTQAREIADEIYGPLGGGASMPSYEDLRGEPAAQTQSPAQQTQGMLPSTVKPVTGEQVDQGLQVAETFPDAEGAKEIQGMASDYNATLMQFASEQDPERKNALGEKLATLETQMGPVLNNLLSTNRDKLAALKQNARDKVAGKNQEEPSFLEKIGLTKPMDQAVQEVSAGTTTVKRQEQKKNKQAYSELTPEEQIAFNESLKTANNRMDSIQGIINNFRQFNPVMYGSGVRDNFVALRDALAEISEGFGKGEFNAAELGNPNSKLTKIYLERVVPNYNVLKEKLDEKILKEQDMAN